MTSKPVTKPPDLFSYRLSWGAKYNKKTLNVEANAEDKFWSALPLNYHVKREIFLVFFPIVNGNFDFQFFELHLANK